MADKGGGNRRASGQDLAASSPDRIRNVVLVGPAGSGKTTLAETLLAASGAIPRTGSVRDGTTVCDHEESEHAHGRSNSLSVAPLVHDALQPPVDVAAGDVSGGERRWDSDEVRGEVVHRPRRARGHRARELVGSCVEDQRAHPRARPLIRAEQVVHARDGTVRRPDVRSGEAGTVTR